ncbi:MAG: hypothetical protein A2156_04020 [Deltaproteobacteria bacterium RBG_16_48_10]|nr:MAG: hypothetical protein A2156_04020 [Deltaproteobacteria bacterium RBG_16_48_10]
MRISENFAGCWGTPRSNVIPSVGISKARTPGSTGRGIDVLRRKIEGGKMAEVRSASVFTPLNLNF